MALPYIQRWQVFDTQGTNYGDFNGGNMWGQHHIPIGVTPDGTVVISFLHDGTQPLVGGLDFHRITNVWEIPPNTTQDANLQIQQSPTFRTSFVSGRDVADVLIDATQSRRYVIPGFNLQYPNQPAYGDNPPWLYDSAIGGSPSYLSNFQINNVQSEATPYAFSCADASGHFWFGYNDTNYSDASGGNVAPQYSNFLRPGTTNVYDGAGINAVNMPWVFWCGYFDGSLWHVQRFKAPYGGTLGGTLLTPILARQTYSFLFPLNDGGGGVILIGQRDGYPEEFVFSESGFSYVNMPNPNSVPTYGSTAAEGYFYDGAAAGIITNFPTTPSLNAFDVAIMPQDSADNYQPSFSVSHVLRAHDGSFYAFFCNTVGTPANGNPPNSPLWPWGPDILHINANGTYDKVVGQVTTGFETGGRQFTKLVQTPEGRLWQIGYGYPYPVADGDFMTVSAISETDASLAGGHNPIAWNANQTLLTVPTQTVLQSLYQCDGFRMAEARNGSVFPTSVTADYPVHMWTINKSDGLYVQVNLPQGPGAGSSGGGGGGGGQTCGVPIDHGNGSTTYNVSSFSINTNNGNTVPGNTLYALIVAGATPSGFSDGTANSYSLRESTGLLYCYECVNASNIVANGAAVTVNLGSAAAAAIWFFELPCALASPDDSGSSGSFGSTNPMSGGSFTASNAVDTVIGFFYWGTTASMTPAAGYTGNTALIFAGGQMMGYVYQQVTATGTYNPQANLNVTTAWDGISFAYKTGASPGYTGGRVPNIPRQAVLPTVGTERGGER